MSSAAVVIGALRVNDCSKEFKQAIHLCRHRQIQTGDNPLGCDVYTKESRQASDTVHTADEA